MFAGRVGIIAVSGTGFDKHLSLAVGVSVLGTARIYGLGFRVEYWDRLSDSGSEFRV